jgi:cysteine synthase B
VPSLLVEREESQTLWDRSAPEPALWRLVGNTPLLPLDLPASLAGRGARLFLKAEWFNPGGSVKDRPAREILRAGFELDALPQRRLLDASSGNTAVAYALLGAAAGVAVTVCVPANASTERKALLRIYGATVIETDALEGSDGAIAAARALFAQEPGRYWYADQYNNPANPRAHELTTGPEIWAGTGGTITHLVAGLGTSGTLLGAGRYLRSMRPDVKLVAVEPAGPLHGLNGLKHMPTALVPGIYDPSVPDQTIRVETEAAEAQVRLWARRGLFVGWSTGAALVAAEQVLRQAVGRAAGGPPVVVVVAPDGGPTYLGELRRLLGEA